MFVLSYSILFSCTSPRMPRTPQLGLAVNMGGDDRTSAARLGQVSLPQILAIFGDSQWFAHRNTKENERKRERERPRDYQENTRARNESNRTRWNSQFFRVWLGLSWVSSCRSCSMCQTREMVSVSGALVPSKARYEPSVAIYVPRETVRCRMYCKMVSISNLA